MNLKSILLIGLLASTAGAQTADTLHTKRPLFTASDAVLLVDSPSLQRLRLLRIAGSRVSCRMKHDRPTGRSIEDRRISRGWIPGGAIAGGTLYLVGMASGDRRIEDLGLHSVEAIAIGNIIVFGQDHRGPGTSVYQQGQREKLQALSRFRKR